MNDKCLCKNIAPEEIARFQEEVPNETTIQLLADFFKVFGDNSRIKILHYLSRAELCVSDLTALAGMQQSAVSHQLKLLRLHRLVKMRKEGVTIYYSIDDDHVSDVFKLALDHITESR